MPRYHQCAKCGTWFSRSLGATAGLPLDGRSLLPVMRSDPGLVWRKRFLVEHWPGDARFLWEIPDYFAIRTGSNDAYPNRVYVQYMFGSTITDLEHYDLNADPHQLRSVHAEVERTAEREVLRQAMDSLLTCGAGTCQSLEN